MGYKLFVFDCDGTLTDLRTWKIVPSGVEALRMLQERGYIVAIASGRIPYSSPMIYEAGINPDYYIGANGHMIEDKNGNLIYEVHVERELFDDVNAFCDERDIGLFWKYHDATRVYHYDPLMQKIDSTVNGFTYARAPEGTPLPFAGAVVTDRGRINMFKEEFSDRCQLVDGGLILFDINIKGINKRTGLENLLKYLGITREETMFFGDGENDLELLEYAGMGVSFRDSSEPARKTADYLTDETYNDGILNALKYFKIL